MNSNIYNNIDLYPTININDLINNLKPYMFMDINCNKNTDNTENNFNSDKKYIKIYKIQAPYFEKKTLIIIKKRRKYNEKIITNNSYRNNDVLFWCFYKIYKNINDNDLQYLNIFTEEKKNKIKFVEELEKKKYILKKFKIKHSILKDELLNDNKISLYI